MWRCHDNNPCRATYGEFDVPFDVFGAEEVERVSGHRRLT